MSLLRSTEEHEPGTISGAVSHEHRLGRLLARAHAERHGWLCWYCGVTLTAATVTADHLIPKAQGGRTERTNIVAACARCNHSKADGPPRLRVTAQDQMRAAVHRTMPMVDHPLAFYYLGLDYSAAIPAPSAR